MANRRLAAIAEGWRIGRQAKAFFGLPWAQWWDRPLSEVREALNVRLDETNAAAA